MESTLQKPAFVAAKTTPKATTRSVFRWIHLVFSIPILGYIYSPFDQIPNYAPATRFVFVPVLVLSGLWMWKGPCRSTTSFEEIGLARRCGNKTTRMKTGQEFGGIKIQ